MNEEEAAAITKLITRLWAAADLHRSVMEVMEQLMQGDPDLETVAGRALDVLAVATQKYEQAVFPMLAGEAEAATDKSAQLMRRLIEKAAGQDGAPRGVLRQNLQPISKSQLKRRAAAPAPDDAPAFYNDYSPKELREVRGELPGYGRAEAQKWAHWCEVRAPEMAQLSYFLFGVAGHDAPAPSVGTAAPKCPLCGGNGYAPHGVAPSAEYEAWDENSKLACSPTDGVSASGGEPLKDHVIREVVSEVTRVALKYHATQQLRENIRHAMQPLIAAAVRGQPMPTGLDPQMGFLLECANAGELAAYDHGSNEMMAALSRILDGTDTGGGVANEPWESLRRRVLALVEKGEIVVTWAGEKIVAVTRQDSEHRILSVLAEAGKPPQGAA